ncbi:uncharacterized protein LOC105649911 isoform X2 [Jatropha curcas]|nr:uncharacterized protein LOC105649911 isoform X2 [Jatropha curcas]XP_037492207.1 uncharacterized protein LOC105649911 isoform X2 [Jatropha curcas]XP_037492208.1 uncharacterized protein LOC105649911 isoform X2 [Jatropha curcas]
MSKSPLEIDLKGKVKVKEEPVMYSNQVRMPRFGAQNKSKFIIKTENMEEQKPSGVVDTMYVVMKEDSKYQRNWVFDGRSKIGAAVAKTFNGRTYMGHVINYQAAKFRVLYENSCFENITRAELEEIEIPPHMVKAYYVELEERRVAAKREQTSMENGPSGSGSQEPKTKKPKKNKNPTNFVALYNEKKRDAYYWY